MDSSIDKKLLEMTRIVQEKLQNILCTIPGKKDLIIEPSLIKPLERVCGASWLKVKGIDKIYKFDTKNPPPKNHQFLYFISSNLITFKYVLDQINGYESGAGLTSPSSQHGHVKKYDIIFFPTRQKCFEVLLEEEGLFDIVGLHQLQWDFLTIDSGVLSIELPQVYGDVFLKNDYTCMSSIAHSIRLLNIVAGKPKVVIVNGKYSEMVMGMVNRLEIFNKNTNDSDNRSDFTASIVIDRNKDYPTCLMTPVVYAGFLAELYTIKTGTIQAEQSTNRMKAGKLDFLAHMSQSEEDKKEVINVNLNSNSDKIYSDHKYLHFSEVITNLSAQAKLLGVEKDQTKHMKISEMKEYVQTKLHKVATQKRELFKHLILCETIMKEFGSSYEKHHEMEDNMINNENRKQVWSYINDLLSTNPHKFNTIRLVCLFHLTMGMTIDEAKQFVKNYCNAFGHKHITVFYSLAAAKIFPDITSATKSTILSTINLSSPMITIPKWQNQFQVEANKLKLLPADDKSNKKPECPSYVFNGVYIPLVAQLANILLTSESFDDFNVKLGHMDQIKVGGRAFDDECFKTIKTIAAEIKRTTTYNEVFPIRVRTIFVFVVGGITYAEIAACRLIEKFTSSKIVIASNCIVSGMDLISSAFD